MSAPECCLNGGDADICPEGHPLSLRGRLNEAIRLSDADPVCHVDDFAEVFAENLRAASAHALIVIAELLLADRSRPEGSGNPGVTGAQPDEPASQAGRPGLGASSDA